MDKSSTAIWRDTFANWPAAFRRKGVLMPTLGDGIPFVDFVMTGDLIVLERATPDNVGARRIAIPFQNIACIKYTEPLKTEQFLQAGYVKGATAPAAPRAKKVPIQPAGQPPAQRQAPAPAPQATAAPISPPTTTAG